MSGHGGYSRVTGGGAEFRKERTQLAKDMVKENQFKYKRDSEKEIRQFIQQTNDMKNGVRVSDDGELVASKVVEERAEKLAKKLAERIEFTDRDIENDYHALKDSLSGKYYIDIKDTKEIDEWRKYQKNSPIKVVSSRVAVDPNNSNKMINVTSLDSVYTELYNDGGNRWGLTNPNGSAAKLVELNNTLRSLREQMKYDIYSDKARAELGATPRQIIQEIKSRLIENAAIAQVLYKDTRAGKGRRKTK